MGDHTHGATATGDDPGQDEVVAAPTTPPEQDRVPSWLVTAAAWSWRLLLLLVVAAALLWLAQRLAIVTLPVFLALVLATLCVPPARRLQARGMNRALATVIVVVGGLVVLGGIVAALVPPFVEQTNALGPTVTAGLDRFFAMVERSPVGWTRAEIVELAQQMTREAGVEDEVAGQVAGAAILVVEVITGAVLTVVLLFFFVKDGEQIADWLVARTAPAYRDLVRATGQRAWSALSGFIRGTVFIATTDAVLIGVGLALLGVPLVLPLALLVFIGAFVPVIGAFVSGLVAVLVALAHSGPLTALAVLAVVVGVQQVEGQLLQPVLMRRSVALHPAAVLIAIFTGAVLAGLPGAFLAVPLAAVASAVTNELRLRHEYHDSTGTKAGPDPLGPTPFGHTGPIEPTRARTAIEQARTRRHERAGEDRGHDPSTSSRGGRRAGGDRRRRERRRP